MEFKFEPITRDQIKAYADASGDHNKIHLDEEFARAAGLPGVIAHGMLSMGLAARALTEWGISPEKVLSFTSKFKDKVLPGDVLTCRSTSDKSEGNQRALDLEIVNQNNNVVLTATAKVKA